MMKEVGYGTLAWGRPTLRVDRGVEAARAGASWETIAHDAGIAPGQYQEEERIAILEAALGAAGFDADGRPGGISDATAH